MPYRRLPNTDAARLKALQTAYDMGREYPPFKLAFSQNAFQKVQSFVPSFEKVISESKQAYDNQVDKNKEYLRTIKKAKLYISHFIQVVNMAIMRGELPVSERNFFKLDEDDKKAPVLNTEQEVIEWGQKIIDGEEIRKAKGRGPITNPTIAVVRVRYEQFMDAYKFQKTLQKNYHRALEKLAEIRSTADEIILQVWNEVEDHYRDLSDEDKRKKSEEYGLTYVFRRNEQQRKLIFHEIES
jgi:hypothetical protein